MSLTRETLMKMNKDVLAGVLLDYRKSMTQLCLL